MKHQHSTFWRNGRRLTSLVVGMFLVMTAFPASAQFKPRDRKPASGNSRGAGSRGCLSSGIPLTQLAPVTFIGKTASTRPTLVWYMSSPDKVRFRLFEFDSATSVKQIGKVQEIPTIVGINQLKLPPNYPELTVDKTYLWQIAINCNENDVIINHAEFTVIKPQLLPDNQFTTILERVNYYAEKELWYEALSEALKATDNGKLGQIGTTLVKDLAQSEIPTGSDINIKNIQQRIEYLQEIVNKESSDVPQKRARGEL
ncbi:MAG: DUF928 domain-containing protein [Nostoc sp. ChiSLP02]|nr:DUF928 domain-containing protein [Nostoc sp. DedSLP05]MDZ8100572.1 DUF928 domain-containing protein [Nostoc sp. DedSLP01]MDZ8189181.1 DUF928 domain-containing protein [Nostoc sp. ChiSLP02]